MFDTFYSWGNPKTQIATAIRAPVIEPGRFNADYLKPQRHIKVPIPNMKEPTLASYGSDHWGYLVAKDIMPLPKEEAFNSTYLQPNPDTVFHIPPPRLYTIEGALASIPNAKEIKTEEKEELEPIERAVKIKDAQEDGSDTAKYWSDIVLTLTKLNDTKSKRSLSGDELDIEKTIIQRIEEYERTDADVKLVQPGAPPIGPNTVINSTQKIIYVIAKPAESLTKLSKL